jgi:hypothetical protein
LTAYDLSIDTLDMHVSRPIIWTLQILTETGTYGFVP